MDILDELNADELPDDRQAVREARILLAGLRSRAAVEINTLRDLIAAMHSEAENYYPSFVENNPTFKLAAEFIEGDEE
jgi:hypothetical protein